MSKGLQYSGGQDPRLPRRIRALPEPEREAYVEAFNEQWRIVGTCAICGEGLIEAEKAPHRLAHVSPAGRTVARDIWRLVERDPEAAREALGAINELWPV